MQAVLRASLFVSSLLLISCMGEMEASSCGCVQPVLLESEFVFDVTTRAGNAPKAPVWNGDTLTVWDYWALLQQPDFRAVAAREADAIGIRYVTVSEASRDWSPPVETRLRLLLPPSSSSEVTLRFHAVPDARAGRGEAEAALGVQDARLERLLILRRP